jgi:hypothetical protein
MNGTRYLPFVGRLLIGLPFAMSDRQAAHRLVGSRMIGNNGRADTTEEV